MNAGLEAVVAQTMPYITPLFWSLETFYDPDGSGETFSNPRLNSAGTAVEGNRQSVLGGLALARQAETALLGDGATGVVHAASRFAAEAPRPLTRALMEEAAESLFIAGAGELACFLTPTMKQSVMPPQPGSMTIMAGAGVLSLEAGDVTMIPTIFGRQDRAILVDLSTFKRAVVAPMRAGAPREDGAFDVSMRTRLAPQDGALAAVIDNLCCC